MTPATNSQQQYIITENQLESLAAGCMNEYGEYNNCIDDEFFNTIRSHPLPTAPEKVPDICGDECPCRFYMCEDSCPISKRDAAVAAQARADAEQTDNILSVLKKRYRNDMAILDYVEMIECEVRSLRQPKENTGSIGGEE